MLESKYVGPEGRPQETGHSPSVLDMSLSLLPLSLFAVLSLHLFESHGSVSLYVHSIYRVFILSCPQAPQMSRKLRHIRSREFRLCIHSLFKLPYVIAHCFSTFMRPRPGKFFFIRRGPGPNRFTRKYLSILF